MSSALRMVDLSKHYGRTTVLDDINLDVPQGSIFGLVGPNGAGKSTAIKIALNLLRPDSGRSEVLDCDSWRLGPREFTRIGYVSENQQMPGWMTVEQWMSYLAPFYPNWDHDLAANMLNRFELPPARKLSQLSRGMWMKAALASSLAYRPELLIMDEPFSGLDLLVREQLIEGMLGAAEDVTILISSHDLSEIESFATHLAYLENGRFRFMEDMDSLLSRFRRIDVTLENACDISRLPDWPERWLLPERRQTLLTFVETAFDPERTPAEVSLRFGGVRQITVERMPLRQIFLAVARSSAHAGSRSPR
jgi:ABC-2 type transport system ATP-binding protein